MQDLRLQRLRALTRHGSLIWEYVVNKPEKSGPGPNGVAVVDGTVYGASPKAVFALNATTGKKIWVNKKLLKKGQGTFGIQPQGGRRTGLPREPVRLGARRRSAAGAQRDERRRCCGSSTQSCTPTRASGRRPRFGRRLGDAPRRHRRLGDLRDRQSLPNGRLGDRAPLQAALHRQRRELERGDRKVELVLPGSP
jgi:hypothetical protein